MFKALYNYKDQYSLKHVVVVVLKLFMNTTEKIRNMTIDIEINFDN